VGGHPERPAVAVADFHESCEVGQRRWPVSMLTTSTHDTKRREDVRARISLLSEMPVEWGAIVERWWVHNRAEAMIDRKTEWLIYETLVGAWPIDGDRLVGYLEKAIREAKTHTSWTDPQPAYEAAIRQFAEGLLEDAWLVGEVEALVSRLRRPGWVNSLALKLLTLTGPGVADLYQGSELWDFSLVDPDNRRPVDFDVRRRLLGRLSSLSLGAAWAEEGGSGLSKMGLVTHALAVRRERPECFGAGNAGCYGPLVTGGWAQGHVVAFTRGSSVVTVVPRLPLALARRGGWEDTTVTLPDGEWGNRLGSAGSWSGTVAVRDLLADFPVALLVRS
jgi:(1->4)-alpha-D-glucan 1-alpha-D-glucosylmutase